MRRRTAEDEASADGCDESNRWNFPSWRSHGNALQGQHFDEIHDIEKTSSAVLIVCGDLSAYGYRVEGVPADCFPPKTVGACPLCLLVFCSLHGVVFDSYPAVRSPFRKIASPPNDESVTKHFFSAAVRQRHTLPPSPRRTGLRLLPPPRLHLLAQRLLPSNPHSQPSRRSQSFYGTSSPPPCLERYRWLPKNDLFARSISATSERPSEDHQPIILCSELRCVSVG